MAVTYKSKSDDHDRLTLRVLKRDKFALEIASRLQDRTLSSIIKEAVDDYLLKNQEVFSTQTQDGDSVPLSDLCWHPFPAHRLINLAMNAPRLLNNREMVIWDVIQADRKYWQNDHAPDRQKVQEHWDEILKVADSLMGDHG